MNRNFSYEIVTALLVIGELELSLLEYKQVVEVLDLFAALFNSSTIVKFLLYNSIKSL